MTTTARRVQPRAYFKPLEQFARNAKDPSGQPVNPDDFMYMGSYAIALATGGIVGEYMVASYDTTEPTPPTVSNGHELVHCYKHRDTRMYLNLSDDLTCWRFDTTGRVSSYYVQRTTDAVKTCFRA